METHHVFNGANWVAHLGPRVRYPWCGPVADLGEIAMAQEDANAQAFGRGLVGAGAGAAIGAAVAEDKATGMLFGGDVGFLVGIALPSQANRASDALFAATSRGS